MLWEIDIHPAEGEPNLEAQQAAADAAELGIANNLHIHAARGYLIEGDVEQPEIESLATHLLCDSIVERPVIAKVGDSRLADLTLNGSAPAQQHLVHVLPKPGVMDPVAQSAMEAITQSGVSASAIRTLRKYWIEGVSEDELTTLCNKLLSNDSIEQVVIGPLQLDRLAIGAPYQFELLSTPLSDLDDAGLLELSRVGQLYLTLVEMQTIQKYYQDLGRNPTDIELESIAQTWSEHCSHKTLAGRIQYRDEKGERRFENMLKETIFEATVQIRKSLGDDDWCVSVFKDNAGVIRFDDEDNVVFKVETHNHPSALEPYGGANTGIGGVIRDPMGTGLGAKPVCNTDVFCFAPPEQNEALPPGVIHPRRVMRGVISGVRDYGNRMGIPTVNGALYFDERYLGNPLVYCGNVGMLPRDKTFKEPLPGDHIVSVGGKTGRDGIHGATFSSAELTEESESLSGGSVQIGNAITEKMVLDIILAARDLGLYSAITDCGAGGFASAVGEMGEEIGAEVWLEKAPLKYEGLSYTEIWISEAQERMVLSVPPAKWEEFLALCQQEGVEASIIGRFGLLNESGKPQLLLKYDDHQVADIEMAFLHDGRPPIVREAVYQPPSTKPLEPSKNADYTKSLLQILASPNVASKEWVIRQYDHEVQGGSVIKPLVGKENDGPSDAAVIRPKLGSRKGLVISCGMNPHLGDLDPYDMAASAIDEAVRNCVAVGADPSRIAILDNFCWGYTDRPETLGSLVRASLACYDIATTLGTPFISGKDSLNNEFSYEDPATQEKQTIGIPSTLLISALGQVEDVSRCITMDLKEPGNLLYLLGTTKDELGGSHYAMVNSLAGGQAPKVDAAQAKKIFAALHGAIDAGLVRSSHDLSEGGLAVAAAEMAFAGGCGATLDLANIPADEALSDVAFLFAESNTRFLLEIEPKHQKALESSLATLPLAKIGVVTKEGKVVLRKGEAILISAANQTMKEAWQSLTKSME